MGVHQRSHVGRSLSVGQHVRRPQTWTRLKFCESRTMRGVNDEKHEHRAKRGTLLPVRNKVRVGSARRR